MVDDFRCRIGRGLHHHNANAARLEMQMDVDLTTGLCGELSFFEQLADRRSIILRGVRNMRPDELADPLSVRRTDSRTVEQPITGLLAILAAWQCFSSHPASRSAANAARAARWLMPLRRAISLTPKPPISPVVKSVEAANATKTAVP